MRIGSLTVIIGMAEQGLLRNQTCQLCLGCEATHFCKCTTAPTLFCMQCFYSHHTKYPLAYHQVLPIAALSQNPEDYKRRSEALSKAATELRSNLDRMEQCSSEFGEMMQNCINFLTEYRSWWLQQLHSEKEELALAVEAAIQEVTNCLCQGAEPVSALAQAVWTRPVEELQGFQYTVSTPDLPTLCPDWAHYQNHLKSFFERSHPIPEEVKEQLPQPPPSPVPRDLFAAIYNERIEPLC